MEIGTENVDVVLMAPFTISNKQCRAYFRSNVLIWKMESSPFSSYTIPISDIIAVNYGNRNTCGGSRSRTNGKFYNYPRAGRKINI